MSARRPSTTVIAAFSHVVAAPSGAAAAHDSESSRSVGRDRQLRVQTACLASADGSTYPQVQRHLRGVQRTAAARLDRGFRLGVGDNIDRASFTTMSDDNASGDDATINGTVKWFNTEKGYGFVLPSDGSSDVFLHISALKRANLQDAPEGSSITFEVVEAQKGRQVGRIVDLDTSTAKPKGPRRRPPPD
jgi:cold shock CspA family protein